MIIYGDLLKYGTPNASTVAHESEVDIASEDLFAFLCCTVLFARLRKELTADLQSPGGPRVNSKKIPTDSIREAPCFGRYVLAQQYDKTPIKRRKEDLFGAVFKDFMSTSHLYLEVPHAEARTRAHINLLCRFLCTSRKRTHPCINSCELRVQTDHPNEGSFSKPCSVLPPTA